MGRRTKRLVAVVDGEKHSAVEGLRDQEAVTTRALDELGASRHLSARRAREHAKVRAHAHEATGWSWAWMQVAVHSPERR